MKLPIVAYGDPVLKKICTPINETYPELKQLIANMWETMYHAKGIGLAAPQVGFPIRLFVVDIKAEEGEEPYKKIFINAQILEETGEPWVFNEGCLSIPDIREDVLRKPRIRIKYQDENFTIHQDWVDGFPARVIQHEYDHIEGKLFTDRLGALTKQLLKKKLEKISKGEINVLYKMRFPKQNKKR